MAKTLAPEKAAVRFGKIAFVSFGFGLLIPYVPIWVPESFPAIIGDVVFVGVFILTPVLSASMAFKQSRLHSVQTQRSLRVFGFRARPVVALILACYALVSFVSSIVLTVIFGMAGHPNWFSESLALLLLEASMFVYPIVLGGLAVVLGVQEARQEKEAGAGVIAGLAVFVGLVALVVSGAALVSAIWRLMS